MWSKWFLQKVGRQMFWQIASLTSDSIIFAMVRVMMLVIALYWFMKRSVS